jgi:C4-dicarboxylate-specific signal transduction histidine kinase
MTTKGVTMTEEDEQMCKELGEVSYAVRPSLETRAARRIRELYADNARLTAELTTARAVIDEARNHDCEQHLSGKTTIYCCMCEALAAHARNEQGTGEQP